MKLGRRCGLSLLFWVPAAGFSFRSLLPWAPEEAPQLSEPQLEKTCPCPEAKDTALLQEEEEEQEGLCHLSKVLIRHEPGSAQGSTNALSLVDLSDIYGNEALDAKQREQVSLAKVQDTPLSCMDDRVSKPALATPGGDLGEFVLGFAAFLQEMDGAQATTPSQEVVNNMLRQYLELVPTSRPMIHCTDERAAVHIAKELGAGVLVDLNAPSETVKQGLLDRLVEPQNQGDLHVRAMLEQPSAYKLPDQLVPRILKAYYSLLWEQQDPNSVLHLQPKLRLDVLVGSSRPQAFMEISAGETCNSKGVAALMTPRQEQRSILVSSLDAVGWRRQELSEFFSHVSNRTPHKLSTTKLRERIERLGWLALETTGKSIAGDLPIYTLKYS